MGWVELTTPVAGAFIGLSLAKEGQSGEGGEGGRLSYGVRDLRATVANLAEAGVELDGEVVTIPDTVMLANFHDPDGNALMLYQGLGEK